MNDLSKRLIKLSLVVTFGRRSDRPFMTSILRSFGAALACMIFGLILALSLWHAALPHDLPVLLVSAVLAVTIFVVNGFVLLATGNLSVYELGEPAVFKQLIILPLDKKSRWLVRVLPLLIISTILACFVCPIIVAISHAMNIPLLVCLAAMVMGLMSSIGYVLLKFTGSFIAKTAIFIGLNLLLFWMIDLVVRSPSSFRAWPLIIDISILVLISFGLIISYFRVKLEPYRISKTMARRFLPINTVYQTWFITKLFRNRRSLGSFIFAFTVSISLSLIVYIRHQASIGGVGWLLFGGFLICSCASDIRGLSRRYKTPEIVALKGVNYFVDIQIFSSLMVNTVVAIPLYLLVIATSVMSVSDVTIYFLSLVLAGSICGLFSSTIFVPESKEIGSQFMTALVAASLLIMMPKVLKFSNLSLTIQSACWFCVASVTYLLIIMVEQARRKKYGYA